MLLTTVDTLTKSVGVQTPAEYTVRKTYVQNIKGKVSKNIYMDFKICAIVELCKT